MTLCRCCIPVPKIENDAYDWYARHNAKLEEVKHKRADIIFIGDSITHFWNKEENISYGWDVWEEFYGKRAVLNLGFGVDRTQNMLWRLEHGEMANQSPKVIVVNAGTNQFSCTVNYSGDTPQEALEGVKALIEKLRSLAPDAALILMALFPRQSPEVQKKLDLFNKLLEEYARSEEGKIIFLDLTDKFLLPDKTFNYDLYYDRRCHPKSAGYRIWANALEPLFSKLL